MLPRTTLPGGVAFEELHSLNGLGMIVARSGDYMDPMRWRNGIQGLSDLETYPGSGGSDPLVRNPINPRGLGAAVPTLTPGINGLMIYPGSGGSDMLVRNPIHPNNAHALFVGALQLGGKNKLADSLQTAPGVNTGGTQQTSGISAWTTLASALGIPGLTGLACGDNPGMGCSCGCNGRAGCGSYSSDGMSGLGDDSSDDTSALSTEVNPDVTDLDWSLTGSILDGVPNWAIYGGLALLVIAIGVPSPISYGSGRKRR